MNPINVICPHCGIDQLVEEEVLNDDEATCGKCKKLLFDEPSVATNPDGSGRFTGKLTGMGF